MSDNRFKKSLAKLDTTPTTKPADGAEQTAREQDTPLPFMESASQPPAATVNASALNDVLGDISAPKRHGKHITLYLSHDVATALSQIAKQRGISQSKVVDRLLKQA